MACLSKNGYTTKQLRAVEIGWPPHKGWKKDMVGKVITKEKYYEYYEFMKHDKT